MGLIAQSLFLVLLLWFKTLDFASSSDCLSHLQMKSMLTPPPPGALKDALVLHIKVP